MNYNKNYYKLYLSFWSEFQVGIYKIKEIKIMKIIPEI